MVGVVEGPIEEGAPNASVLRVRSQVGTDANGVPRQVTIPLNVSPERATCRKVLL